jgi:hypothetical protein
MASRWRVRCAQLRPNCCTTRIEDCRYVFEGSEAIAAVDGRIGQIQFLASNVGHFQLTTHGKRFAILLSPERVGQPKYFPVLQ